MKESVDAELKNYGDIEAILKANPLLNALALWGIGQMLPVMMAHLDERLPAKESKLYTYEEAADHMKVTVDDLRHMKHKGYIVATKLTPNGRFVRFTWKAIEEAIAGMEQRKQETTRKRQAHMAVVGINRHLPKSA